MAANPLGIWCGGGRSRSAASFFCQGGEMAWDEELKCKLCQKPERYGVQAARPNSAKSQELRGLLHEPC